MTVAISRPEAPSGASVMVWDPLVRVFHWTLAFGCIANLTVLREAEDLHRFVGYGVTAALAVRLVWGLVGRGHARFGDFVPGPRRLLGYCRALLRGGEPRYIGHNPAAAVMILALIGVAGACGVTGWMMGLDAFWGDKRVEAVHETAANLILIMALVHVGAAIIESRRHGENLILSMITGRKRAPKGTDVCHASAAD